ncbi:uncharacterized protein GGS22DRAFT_35198 [Annulohypoxylon maeteangense]|uniref:uncharacterized protein n=1 Tax=Annulohypoxylon maeteangense TaxID=1927788 RepID=UPI0020081B3C|nr:uncharacterized protein GGS22DRAFT_35198 [Annulohypoxylon maeteangense]KAI0883058.1 hypothetical protein GGS22DRAFT_35198 [Annulohypoxylon maeteangense]
MADTPNIVSATSNQHDATPASVELTTSTPSQVKEVKEVKTNSHRPPTPKKVPLHQIYALPAPIRTFPLPSFYPNNPISLFHAVYAWVSQLVSPPPVEPSVIYQGIWSPETRSVHITDLKSVRALWEQGFFGKGNYSRSEPNWFRREQARRGEHGGSVAENVTTQRREERKLMKWDRARKEQEAIERTRLLEAWVAPVGPMELLALPNSLDDLKPMFFNTPVTADSVQGFVANGTNSVNAITTTDAPALNGTTSPSSNGIVKAATGVSSTEDGTTPPSEMNGHPPRPRTPTNTSKRRKSVRFSPTIESTTFKLSDPPSPHHSVQSNGSIDSTLANGISSKPQPTELGLPESLESTTNSKANSRTSSELDGQLVDKEHLQLCLEEAFYLVFALGALTILDPATSKPIPSSDLFTLCRQTSYIPPRQADLQPDDPFLMHYAAYHHFRSLGWVTRPGIKFGVDWMLYNKGPVFSHAEFAVIVLPAYTDPWWKAQGRQPPHRSWHWLHTINRVQATALKTLVLAYVDIPPPFEEGLGATDILKRYKVREFIVKRWLSNRNRD